MYSIYLSHSIHLVCTQSSILLCCTDYSILLCTDYSIHLDTHFYSIYLAAQITQSCCAQITRLLNLVVHKITLSCCADYPIHLDAQFYSILLCTNYSIYLAVLCRLLNLSRCTAYRITAISGSSPNRRIVLLQYYLLISQMRLFLRSISKIMVGAL